MFRLLLLNTWYWHCIVILWGKLHLSACLEQDASNRGPSGSPRTTHRSASGTVASVMPMQSGAKKIDPNMKSVCYLLVLECGLCMSAPLSVSSASEPGELGGTPQYPCAFLLGWRSLELSGNHACMWSHAKFWQKTCSSFWKLMNVSLLVWAGGQTSEGVLANFFNSLLSKKAGSPGPGSSPAGGHTPGTTKKSGTKSTKSSLGQPLWTWEDLYSL